MSGLKEFLAPYSQLLFANRNFVIVILCFVAGGVAIIALLDRWRADRLERDLESAKSNAGIAPLGRRYSPGGAMEAAPQEAGGPLPPVKGGRTYARNLGNALQKAGMSGPQIYSPPTPAGFQPQQTPMQPMGQPGQAAPYAPNVPWASPAPQPPTPWAFPAAGRSGPGPAPANAPFYQPQPAGGPPPSPLTSPPPPAPPFGGPGVYAPPAAAPGGFQPPHPGPFAPPAFPAASQGSAPPPAPGPAFTPPAAGPVMTPIPLPPVAQPPAETESDAARRGKPKRRRFNFNVLENLEKMVQSRPAEPAAPPTPVPPVPAPAAPSAFSAPATPPAPPLTPEPAAPTAPAPTSATPPAEAATPTVEAPSLPFFFGKRDDARSGKTSQPEPAPTPPAPIEAEPEPEAVHAEEPEVSAPVEEPAPVVEEKAVTPLEEAPAPPQAKDDTRRSMRSMMFGEEIVSAAAPADEEAELPAVESQEASTAEPAATGSGESAATEPSDSETAWPSPWSGREEASSSAEGEPSTREPAAEPASEPAHDEEPAIHGKPFGSYDPWTPAEPEAAGDAPEPWRSEAEPEVEPVAEPVSEATPGEEPKEEPAAAATAASPDEHAPEPPVTDDGDKAGAGTLVIIEDDQTAASYYATLFRGNGYQVEVANDGVSGVDLCARVQPQVILLDVMMPRQNGILVLQTLRASDETKNTPVVVMSNFSEPTLIKRAIQLGALEYVIKTQVEGPALLNALPRWINREKAFAAA